MMPSAALRYPKSLWSYNPIPRSCLVYMPLWSPGLNGSVFRTVDSYQRTATVVGATSIDGGRLFDGNDDFISVPDSTEWDFAGGEFTVAGWTRPDDAGGAVRIVASQSIDASNRVFVLYTSGGALFAIASTDGTTWGVSLSGGTVSATTWYFVVFRRIGNVWEVFLDGTSVDSATVAGSLHDENTVMKFGRDFDAGGGFHKGRLGDLWVYNRGLTNAEITYMDGQTRGRYR